MTTLHEGPNAFNQDRACPASPYRVSPHNIELEQALLGAILVNNEAFYRVSDFVEPRHFFEPLHREIFEIASRLY
jgi:replicative DNA helicase